VGVVCGCGVWVWCVCVYVCVYVCVCVKQQFYIKHDKFNQNKFTVFIKLTC
jgi:hypothetical protein